MKIAVALSFTLLIGASMANVGTKLQQSGRPVRIQVNHADPWMIVAILDGQRVMSPEMSSAFDFRGFTTTNANPRYGKGKLFVNPNDNSIWFYPER